MSLYLIWFYIKFLCFLLLSSIPCWTPYYFIKVSSTSTRWKPYGFPDLEGFCETNYSACCFLLIYDDSCKVVWLVFKAYGAWALVQHYSYLIYYQIAVPHIWNSLVSDNITSLQGINSKANFVLATWKLRCLTWSTVCVFVCFVAILYAFWNNENNCSYKLFPSTLTVSGQTHILFWKFCSDFVLYSILNIFCYWYNCFHNFFFITC